MKTIYFQMIADSRFHGAIANKISELHTQVLSACEKAGIAIESNGIAQFLDFQDGTQQYRIDYKIRKTHQHTYNTIYKTINSVKAVPYTVK